MTEIVKTCIRRYAITAVALDLLDCTEQYRRVRQGRRYGGLGCFVCGHPFEDGEKISLAFCNQGNKTVCRKCGETLQRELAENGGGQP